MFYFYFNIFILKMEKNINMFMNWICGTPPLWLPKPNIWTMWPVGPALTIVYGPHVACSSAWLIPSEACCLCQSSIGQRDGYSCPSAEKKMETWNLNWNKIHKHIHTDVHLYPL